MSLERLQKMATGYVEAKILLAAAELRIFDRLAGDGATAGEVLEVTGGTLRGVEILLDALAAMEILEKSEGTYRLAEGYAGHLGEDSPTHFPALLRHRNRLFRSWAFLEERITGGEVVAPTFDRSVVTDEKTNEDFIRAMYAVGHDNAAAVADRLDFTGVGTVADLGGGPGHYLEEFLSRAPDARGYLVDLPLTLKVAGRLLESSPQRERIDLVTWDFYAEDAPEGLPPLDLVFISQVLHAMSADRNREFLARLFPLVAPGGLVVVHENVVEADRVSPADAALFAINMLVMTEGGRTYTEGEILSWGEATGYLAEPGERIHQRSALVRLRRPAGA